MIKRSGGRDDTSGELLAGLGPESAASLLSMAGDIALVVNHAGVITKVSFGAGEPIEESERWVGQPWVDTVSPDSRAKIEMLLRDVALAGVSQRRQVNYATPAGADIPVAYSAVRLGKTGDCIAVGRDLRAISALQQRLVETQQAMERDYWRLRHVETRYRLLFQFSMEAILVVDAATLRVVDANAAAEELLGRPSDQIVGKMFPVGLAGDDLRIASDLLATARTLGRASDVHVRLARTGDEILLSATCFRQDASSLFMVRLARANGARDAGEEDRTSQLLALVAGAPDAFVVTDLDGSVRTANRAFLDIAQLTSEEQSVGRPLGDWIGRPGADLPVFLNMLGKHGTVRLVSTAARGQHGALTEVEVSAVSMPDASPPGIGFILRDIGRRVAHGPRGARDLTTAVEQLTGLVGRVAVRDLIRDTTDLVERHFIEAALELTDDNRTAAAEVLGLSRQSLYVKLRRFGLAEHAAEGEAEDE